MGERICAHLGISLSPNEDREVEDGEHNTRPLVSVRGKGVFVVYFLYGDELQSVSRFLFFLGALRDASAGRVTAVAPYLCYARRDRKSKARNPVTTRYVAGLFEAVGADCVVTMDVHILAAFQNVFPVRTEHLETRRLFVDYFAPFARGEGVAVVSPDSCGVKRAEDFRRTLGRATGRPALSAFFGKTS